MKKNRLEAFSDGVLAIIITIMVLEIKVPHGELFSDLYSLLPVFLSYVLSFIYIGIYWNNHHHLLHTVNSISGGILWANMHLLFWLSLVPFATGWMGENHFGNAPIALYGFVLLMCAVSYYILQLCIIKQEGNNGLLAQALGSDMKGKLSLVFYLLAITASFYFAVVSLCIYVLVALIWLVPDKRIEKILKERNN